MSINFWIKLMSALTLFGLAIVAVQLYKSELVRDLRARFLRRKIVPNVQAILSLVIGYAQAANVESNSIGNHYALMRQRADLEALYRQAKPLFDQERHSIAEFLSQVAQLSVQFEQGQPPRYDLENTILQGQRVIQELTEIGL